MLFSTKASSLFFAMAATSAVLMVDPVNAHGYLKTPRSRNFVAAQDGVGWGGTTRDPAVEFCPQCLNRGGTVAACGKTDDKNYDFPPSAIDGQMMPPNVQASTVVGGEIDVEVVLTAHHKGHFVFSACPVTADDPHPSIDCFEKNRLHVVQDLMYGSPVDTTFPERAYIPPLTYDGIVTDTSGSIPGSLFSYRLKLPENIEGELVLLQWHYLSANSCTHDGYNDYAFPTEWGDVNYAHLPHCGPIPEDGDGVPEQFWNCAEISVTDGGTTPAGTSSPTPAPVPATAAPVTMAPTATVTTTAPVGTATSAPSKAPIVATPAPTSATPVATTPSPTITTPVDGGEFVISTSARCGVSEIDARGNCGAECSSASDCADGQWCWSVQHNYCGTRPNFSICDDLPEANTRSRCGISELDARETCGVPCVNDSQCIGSGELCYATHMNTCDCISGNTDGSPGRSLRGVAALFL